MARVAGFLAGAVMLAGCGLLPLRDSDTPSEPVRMPRIGFVGGPGANYEGFLEGLRDLGYVEGQTFILEPRFSSGPDAHMRELASDLVQLPVAVIAAGPAGAIAAAQVTQTTPIVLIVGSDPVVLGLAASHARPGGNVTGVMTAPPEMVGKQLQLLKEAAPHASHAAVLLSAEDPANVARTQVLHAAAQSLGLGLLILEIGMSDDIEAAFTALREAGAEGIVVAPGNVTSSRARGIIELALNNQMPTVFGRREEAVAGALMSYGADLAAARRYSAVYVDKILKGAKPSDLPIEGPKQFDFVINFKTAQALGLSIPSSLMLASTEVIQ